MNQLQKDFLKSPHQLRIEEFMRQAGQDVPETPAIPSDDVLVLRARLIFEEAIETIEALGCQLDVANIDLHTGRMQLGIIRNEDIDPDVIGVLDGCADLSVVTIGTLSAFGVADCPVLEEVDQSNLAKFGPGGHRREDGKWIKPQDWQPPDLLAIYQEQGGELPPAKSMAVDLSTGEE